MSDPYLGEIRLFGGTFAPQGWRFCDGSLLSIAEFNALFAVIGQVYGGDGQVTFGLPDLRGRSPIHSGQGPGLAARTLGQTMGAESVTLTPLELPSHTHTLQVADRTANGRAPRLGALGVAVEPTFAPGPPDGVMAPDAVVPAGGDQPHENMQPFLALNFIIAVEGIFPARG